MGEAADQLRQYICNALLERNTMREILPYFAELSGSTTVSLRHYKSWVAKLRYSEFADELVVAVTAQKLGVPIVVIPAVPEWKIQTHPHPDLHAHLAINSNDAIYLGFLHVHKI